MSIALLALLVFYLAVNVVIIALVTFRTLQLLGFYAWCYDLFGVFGLFVSIPLTIILLAVIVWAALFFIIYSGLLWLIVVFVCIEAHRRYRASRQYSLLWLLAISAERGIPLTTSLEAFASERRGYFARGARKLAAMLESGVDFPDALDQSPGMLPPQALPLIRVGCKSGSLGPALRRASSFGNLLEPMWMSIVGKIGYLMMLTLVGLSLFWFIMAKILPSFEMIFQDFDMELPSVTNNLVSWAGFMADYGILLVPAYLAIFVFLLMPAAKYFGWHPPGLNLITRRLDAADLLDGLSLAVQQRLSMLDGLRAMARSYPRSDIKARLWKTVKDVVDGGDWAESLHARGFLRRIDLAVVQSAQRADNLSWALREIAESNRRRFMYRLQATVQTVFPLAVVALGVGVGCVVFGLFIPLLKLITQCS